MCPPSQYKLNFFVSWNFLCFLNVFSFVEFILAAYFNKYVHILVITQLNNFARVIATICLCFLSARWFQTFKHCWSWTKWNEIVHGFFNIKSASMWTDGIMDKDASESGNSSPFKELETFLFVHQFLFLFFCWGREA